MLGESKVNANTYSEISRWLYVSEARIPEADFASTRKPVVIKSTLARLEIVWGGCHHLISNSIPHSLAGNALSES